MKFAFCLFKYFPSGGLQRGFLQLAKACISRGHQVDVYTGSWEGKQLDNLKIFIIPNKGITNHNRYKSFAKRLDNYVTAKHYDAVVGFNKMPGLDIYFASDTCFAIKALERSLLYRLSRRCKTLMYLEDAVFNKKSKTEIISISDNEKKLYMEYYGTAEQHFHSVPPGISMDRLTPPKSQNAQKIRDDFRHAFSIKSNQYVVLMVGSDYKRKGVDRAIKAISALPPLFRKKTILMVVGKGRVRPYSKLAKKKGISSLINFVGERDDVPRFLVGADILLHPAYQENTGTVLIEAMAAGLPVLVTENCGYSFHIELANAGKLVPSPFVQETLNNTLISMLTSEKKQWQVNGKKYIAQTDVYSRHEKAANVIEMVASR
ncbi:MAG: glycosyltransferase family 4 protein [Thermodesulfobacteriota bacterium]|nr:glycosyltransferase family 4 protein [Thermodesulfobacteriota bacterium]